MPENKFFKQTINTLKLLTVAGATYHVWYHKNNSLVTNNPGELELSNHNILDLNWISGDDYATQMEAIVLPYLAKFRQQTSRTINGHLIAIDCYLLPKPAQTFVIVHGFNEYKEKFHEIIYYLLQANIQVVVYDQRGHGFSKTNPLQSQINITDFNDYVVDFQHIMKDVVLAIAQNTPIVLFGHSMGGAVVTSYLETNDAIADLAILNAPMIDIETGIYPQSFSHLLSRFISKTPFGMAYIPTTDAFDPLKHTAFNVENDLTHYPKRNEYTHNLNLALHELPTRGGSYNWLAASLNQIWEIRKQENIAKIKQPVLLFRAEDDTIVRSKGLFTLNKYLPKVFPILVPNSKHEIFQENDQIVQAYVSHMIQFIQHMV